MRDLGLITHNEPIARLFTPGMVQRERRGHEVHRGNVSGGRRKAQKYGATRGGSTPCAAPPEKDLEWSEREHRRLLRFLNPCTGLVDRHALTAPKTLKGGNMAAHFDGFSKRKDSPA